MATRMSAAAAAITHFSSANAESPVNPGAAANAATTALGEVGSASAAVAAPVAMGRIYCRDGFSCIHRLFIDDNCCNAVKNNVLRATLRLVHRCRRNVGNADDQELLPLGVQVDGHLYGIFHARERHILVRKT